MKIQLLLWPSCRAIHPSHGVHTQHGDIQRGWKENGTLTVESKAPWWMQVWKVSGCSFGQLCCCFYKLQFPSTRLLYAAGLNSCTNYQQL